MSIPYLFSRPSGYVVRFLVPKAYRAIVGRRFVVRSLKTSNLDQARLSAAILAVQLTKFYESLTLGRELTTNKDYSGYAASLTHLRIEKATTQDGTVLEGTTIENENDRILFEQLLRNGGFKPILPEPARRKDTSGMLSDRIQSFFQLRETGQQSPKTLGDARFVLENILLELCGDKPLHEIGTDDADKVFDALMCMPPNASKNKIYSGLSTAKILEKAKSTNAQGLAPRTIDKYLDRVKAFFNHAVKCKYIPDHPFQNRSVMSKQKRGQQQKRAFSDDDLKLIFDPFKRAKNIEKPHQFWGPLIALFSGMRVNEIAQLYLEDIHNNQGTWEFLVRDHHADQKLKNAASKRPVPIHNELIQLGLLQYVDDVKGYGFNRLFPNLPHSPLNGYGDALGDWFNGRYLRSSSGPRTKPRAGIDDLTKTFHSFRHVVSNRLDQVTDNKTHIKELTGHDRGDDVLTSVYITPAEAKRRACLLNKITFESLTFEQYKKDQYLGFFKRLNRSSEKITEK